MKTKQCMQATANSSVCDVQWVHLARFNHKPSARCLKRHFIDKYEVVSNNCKNYHVHDWPGRTRVIDSRQLIPFMFSVQTGQLASLVNMMILTMVG